MNQNFLKIYFHIFLYIQAILYCCTLLLLYCYYRYINQYFEPNSLVTFKMSASVHGSRQHGQFIPQLGALRVVPQEGMTLRWQGTRSGVRVWTENVAL